MQANHFPSHINPAMLQGGQGQQGFNQSQGFDPRVFQQGTPNPNQAFMNQQNGGPRPRVPSGGQGMNPMMLQQQQALMAQRQSSIDGLNPALMGGMGGGGGGGMAAAWVHHGLASVHAIPQYRATGDTLSIFCSRATG